MVSHSLRLGETIKSNFTRGDASPGYFSLTLNNSIRMEATSTRRAGLERFSFPKGNTPFFTLDLSNDLPHSFRGGNMTIDTKAGRITIGGYWGSRYATRSTSVHPRRLTMRLAVLGPGRSNTKRSPVTTSTMAHRNWINSASGPWTRLYLSSYCFRLVNQTLATQERPCHTRTWQNTTRNPR